MKEKYFKWIIAATLLLVMASSAQGGTWSFHSKDQGVEAYAPKNAVCSPVYEILIIAPQATDFCGSKTKVQHVFDIVRTKLNAECPQVKTIMVTGRAKKKDVYSGKASETGNWELVDIVGPPDTFRLCRIADPENFNDVFKCMASAKFPNSTANMFEGNIRTSDCRDISGTYIHFFTLNGYSREEALDRLPSCEIFAKATKEMTGELPFWSLCTGYGKKDAKVHLNDCLGEFVPKYYGNKNKLKQIVGCEQVRKEYENALRSADPDRKLPAGYVPPSSSDADELVATWTGKDPRTHPCAGYDSNNVPGHISKCFADPLVKPFLGTVRNCSDARRLYEQKLREAYGGLPPGYIMTSCSDLEPLLAMAENLRTEVAAKEQERKRKKAERKRKRIEQNNAPPVLSTDGENADIHQKPEEIITNCDHLAAHFGDPLKPAKLNGMADEKVNIQSAIDACMVAVESSPENARYKFQLGRALVLGGAYEEGVSFLQEASNSGHAAAKFYLSDLYATGHGVPEDMQVAQKLYDEALAGGFSPVDFSQFGWPEFLRAAYEGNTKRFVAEPLGAMCYVSNINNALGQNTYYASDQAALLRVYDPTLENVIERKNLTNANIRKHNLEVTGEAAIKFAELISGEKIREKKEKANKDTLTIAEIKALGSRDGKLFVYLFNDNPEVFIKLYDGIKRFVHKEL